MTAITNFFSMIGEFISQIVNSVTGFFRLILSVVTFIPDMFGWVDPVLLGLFVGIMAILIIKLMVGR